MYVLKYKNAQYICLIFSAIVQYWMKIYLQQDYSADFAIKTSLQP